jgi:hypothetical protein
LEFVTVGSRPPALLTVDEAAAVMRIGRTKAYAMAREWRATGGASGLPVIDFGNTLRVPRHALEHVIGAPITEIAAVANHPDAEPAAFDVPEDTAPVPPSAPAGPTPEPQASRRSPTRARRSRRTLPRDPNQLDLFELPPSA